MNDSGSVTRLRLGDNGLMGPMPPEIGDLASLEVLLLGSGSYGTGEEESNELTGPIPAELGKLASLRILTLADNSLSGPIPPELGRLSSLTSLWLFDNQLTGTIPSALGNLTNLRSLYLLGNALSGPVPRELGELSSLGSLDLSSNALIGHLSSELSGGLARVEWFSWENNDGLCVPNTGSFNTWLETMRAWHGPRCGLPEERDALVVFYGAAGGSEWENNKNWLTDKPLEDWHGVYAGEDGNVTDISLRRNNLVGTIPAELGELTSLLSLNPDPAIVGAGLVREGGRSRAVEALTIVRS